MRAVRANARSRLWLDTWKLRVPVFGKLWHKQAIARFSRTFASLYAAAIPMLQILAITSKVVNNDAVARLILDARDSVRSGQPIAVPFRNSRLFPPMVVQMLAIGEQSGSLDLMMEKVADFYEADVDTMADRLKSMLEPILLLATAVLVGGIVTAIMLPVFKLMENMPGL
jgi:type IV pilus assembly protein PilC